MSSEYLTVMPRTPQKKAKQLRQEGYVPGVLYGRDITTVPILFNRRDIEAFVQRKGESAVFEISMEGKVLSVKIQEIQKNPINKNIMHLDLMKVDLDEVIKAMVPLRFEDREAVERLGYIIQLQKESIEVEGRTKEIPPYITVSLSPLEKNHNLRVADLQIPDNLTVIDEPEEVIASALKPSAAKAAESEEAEDSEEREPELVGGDN